MRKNSICYQKTEMMLGKWSPGRSENPIPGDFLRILIFASIVSFPSSNTELVIGKTYCNLEEFSNLLNFSWFLFPIAEMQINKNCGFFFFFFFFVWVKSYCRIYLFRKCFTTILDDFQTHLNRMPCCLQMALFVRNVFIKGKPFTAYLFLFRNGGEMLSGYKHVLWNAFIVQYKIYTLIVYIYYKNIFFHRDSRNEG